MDAAPVEPPTSFRAWSGTLPAITLQGVALLAMVRNAIRRAGRRQRRLRDQLAVKSAVQRRMRYLTEGGGRSARSYRQSPAERGQ
jgi:hypothetical protein